MSRSFQRKQCRMKVCVRHVYAWKWPNLSSECFHVSFRFAVITYGDDILMESLLSGEFSADGL